MKRSNWLSLALSLALLAGHSPGAAVADDRGLQIATQVDERDTGLAISPRISP